MDKHMKKCIYSKRGLPIKKCPICLEIFEANPPQQKYCSEKCFEFKETKRRKLFERKKRKKIRTTVKKLIGDTCLVCGSTENICFHEIHGKNHSFDNFNKLITYDKIIAYIVKNYQDFRPICRKHHYILHTIAEISNKKTFFELLSLLLNSCGDKYVEK